MSSLLGPPFTINDLGDVIVGAVDVEVKALRARLEELFVDLEDALEQSTDSEEVAEVKLHLAVVLKRLEHPLFRTCKVWWERCKFNGLRQSMVKWARQVARRNSLKASKSLSTEWEKEHRAQLHAELEYRLAGPNAEGYWLGLAAHLAPRITAGCRKIKPKLVELRDTYIREESYSFDVNLSALANSMVPFEKHATTRVVEAGIRTYAKWKQR